MCQPTTFYAIAAFAIACGGSQPANVAGPTPGPGLTTPAPTGVAVPPPHRVTTVEGITEYKLANGMKVLLFPDDSQSTVTVNITYFVGSRHEGYGETGMAHLLEHMVFKGTKTRENIWKELQDHGARFNGTTWVDRTNYYETFPASEENLKWALYMEADRMTGSLLAPEELAKEFSVVRNEFEMGENNPISILQERIENVAFLWHNYGKSTIGNRSDIERVPAERLRRFYEKYYRPDNAMLVVAGRFDTDKTLELVNKSFGVIANPAGKVEATYTVEPVQDGERDVTLRRVGSVQAFGAAYHTVAGSHADAIPLLAAESILTSRPSGRLYKQFVASKKATRVWGTMYPFHDASTSGFYVEVPVGKNLATIEKAFTSAIEGFAKTKITDAEVSRYRTKAQKDWELSFTNSARVAVQLSEYAALGDWRTMFVYRDRLEKLTAADVARVAKAYFKRSNRTTGRFVPTKTPDRAPEVEAPNVAALVDGYKGRGKLAAGERFEATLANIEKRTERATLKNGMKAALLSKKTRGNAVRARMTLRFARERDLTGKVTAVQMIPEMLMRGTKKRSYQQIRDTFDQLKADVRFGGANPLGGSPNEVTISISTTNDNLAKVLELVAEILKEPSFPNDQFKLVIDKGLADLEKQKTDPQARGILAAVRKVMAVKKSDVRYVPTLEEQGALIKKVRLADLKKFHSSYYGASSADIAIVGDFDPSQIKEVLAAQFGSWTSKTKYERIALPFRKHKGEKLEVNTPDKKNAIIFGVHTINARDDDPDFAALEIGSYIFGGGGSSRLMTRLRHKGGLSYGAGGGAQVSSHEKSGMLVAFAICAPQNMDKAMAAMLDEVQKLADKGVAEKELKEAKAAYLEAKKGGLSNDRVVAGMLGEGLELGRTTAFQEKLNAEIAKLTVAQVNAALKKHIKPGRLITVKAGDLAKRSATK